ncbi:MAG: sulfatase [Cytophagales bacterium]|nr:sulfatase [Cytophagales bacterium]
MKGALVVLFSFVFLGLNARESHKPNIIFFLIDDLGWSDLGCYGSKFYETPHIDKLAGEGMSFTSAYMMPTCAPSRASLMTGEYPPRTGIYAVDAYAGTPLKMQRVKGIGSKKFLSPNDITIAEVLKNAGYINGHFGKWHLGNASETYPLAQGFDVNIGGCETGAPRSFFSPYLNVKHIEPQKDGKYLPDVLTDGACRFIEENKNNPFFLYFPFYLVHVPLHAKKEWAAKYAKKKSDGEQSIPAYGAMVSYMDLCVGRVLKKIEELDLNENTIVIFTSDNGGQIAATSNAPLKGQKGNLHEGGIRVPLIIKWPGKVKKATKNDTPVSVVDFYPTLAEMAGANLPKEKFIDGLSIVPLLAGKGKLKREAIFWHLTSYNGNGRSNSLLWQPPGGAIRKGSWKLIENFEDGSLQLYNLKNDLGEKENLKDKYSKKTKELLKELKAWQKKTKAPIPNEINPLFEESSILWIEKQNMRNQSEVKRLTLIK